MGWKAITRGVEDQASLGPLHAVASVAIYAWPIAISVIAAKTSHCSFRDIPTHAPGTKVIVRGGIILVLILCVVFVGTILDSIALYRIGHTALELFILSWFLFASARPDLFSKVRREIHDEHIKNRLLSDEEARIIGERIARVSADPAVLGRSDMNLRILAGIIKVPPYRLSNYFNVKLKTSFPSWLNAWRIERVRKQIVEEPERSILDLAMEAGFGSKSVFNANFSRIVGMSPSEYRRRLGSAPASRRGDDILERDQLRPIV
jgi:AraC-like DNA-binding protein